MPFSNTGGLVGPTASASSSGALLCAPPVEHRVFSRSSFIDQWFVPTMLCIPFSISEFPESTFQITRLYVYGGLLQDREPCTGNRLIEYLFILTYLTASVASCLEYTMYHR